MRGKRKERKRRVKRKVWPTWEEKEEDMSKRLVRQETTATVRNGLCPGQPLEWVSSASGLNSPPIAQNFLKRNNTKKLEMLQLASLEIYTYILLSSMGLHVIKKSPWAQQSWAQKKNPLTRGAAPPGKFGEHPLQPVKESGWAPLDHASPLITQKSHKPINGPLDPRIKLTTPLHSLSQPK